MIITVEAKEKNLKMYFKRLGQLGIDTSCFEDIYGGRLLNASFTNSNEYGNAYDGSFLEILLRVLTPYAVRLNELLPEAQRVDKDTLIKICLLHQISKCVKLIPNDNSWEVEKRGLVYKYDNTLPSIRTGLHSLVMCQNCGIEFSAEEAEAMTICDRDATDEQSRWFSSVMATIIRQANELTYLEINNKR